MRLAYEAARDHLRNPDHWCGEGKTRDKERNAGCLVHTLMAFGSTYEIWGRLDLIARRLDPTMSGALLRVITGPSILFNDSHSHAEVLELLNIAIAELQSEKAKAVGFWEAPCPTAA